MKERGGMYYEALEKNPNISDRIYYRCRIYFAPVDNKGELFWHMSLGLYSLLYNFDGFSVDYEKEIVNVL